jgi:prophage antirepressor-like protein
MPDLIPFCFDAHEIRVHLDEHGVSWWVAKDICDVLGIKNPTDALKALESHEKALGKVETLGGSQQLLVMNEAGLYRLIFRSNKPDAKRFQSWVFSEVLPAIRKTGHYAPTPPAIDHHPDLRAIVQLAHGLAETRDVAEAAKAEAEQARLAAAHAEAKAEQAIHGQAWVTIYQYVTIHKLKRQMPQSVQEAYGRWLTRYCREKGYRVYPQPVAYQRWKDENTYYVGTINATLPGWLSRCQGQGTLLMLPRGE